MKLENWFQNLQLQMGQLHLMPLRHGGGGGRGHNEVRAAVRRRLLQGGGGVLTHSLKAPGFNP
jgi:hypothetical protein